MTHTPLCGDREQWLPKMTRWIALSWFLCGEPLTLVRAVQAAPEDPHAAQCELLANVDLAGIEDAPTDVTEAKWMSATGELPAHCKVQGYISPHVGFELKLPGQWNGKFLHIGCGGFCGRALPPHGAVFGCPAALKKGYACAGTDMGHQGAGVKWAYHNLPAEIDFAFRATHVSTVAAKAIIGRYYGISPKRAYFAGCSTGGRQALVAAQRFPWDFDGIVAMDPAINWTEVLVTFLWNALLSRDHDGKAIFSERDIHTLHEAVVSKCDLNDGVRDGLIGDPRDCTFDPSELACTSSSRSACLTPVQIATARKIYDGPRTSTGERIARGGSMLGAETGTSGLAIAASATDTTSIMEFFRYAGFWPDPGAQWKPTDFDFDRDYKRLGMMEALYASANPDLRKFKARGGKLLVSQGWHDNGMPFAFNTIDYYETVERTMDGRAATQEFFRLFMVPGRDHCGGGKGAWAIDHLSYLETWVEQGKAPDVVMSAHPRDAKAVTMTFPLASEKVEFSRPLYPYPICTKYKGAGDPNKAENFAPTQEWERRRMRE